MEGEDLGLPVDGWVIFSQPWETEDGWAVELGYQEGDRFGVVANLEVSSCSLDGDGGASTISEV